MNRRVVECQKVRRMILQSRRRYTGMPPPPPPPFPPSPGYPYHSSGMGYGNATAQGVDHHPADQPLIVQVKATRFEVARQLLWLGLTGGVLGYAYWTLTSSWDPQSIASGKSGVFKSGDVKPTDLTNFTITFSEVLGCDEAKEELEEVVDFLKNPSKYTRLGGKLPKGALLVGPPGTGKTMLAKAIAKEAGVPFFYMSGAEFDEVFVGVGSRRVRELFEAAKKNTPSLIFIDELDAIGSKRSAKDSSYHRMTLNQMLSEMDGFLSSDEVIVIGATNTPKTLDPALTRPGRFDKIISVDPPDIKGRESILNMYLSKVKKSPDISAFTIAKGLPGFCGADLKNVVNIAALRAAMQDKKMITDEDLEYARDRVSMGAENRSKVIPEKERKITAWHEAGHALTALLSQGADPVHKATIIPRGGGILGLVLQYPEEDRYSESREMMHARLKVCLAGRAAEEVYLGHADVTSGAASDFEQATSLARTMVRKYGMDEKGVGVVDYSSTMFLEGRYLSEETKKKIESATRGLLDESYAECSKLLKNNKHTLKAIAEALLVHETLNASQLATLVKGEPLPPPKQAITSSSEGLSKQASQQPVSDDPSDSGKKKSTFL